ncbi:MAG TPA: hypothetical protein VFY48_03190 [Solirubrobacterales bacterium]|nr:hypothetical protein [Solirubrobacterales bacterium]
MLRRRLDEIAPKSPPDPSVISSTEEGRARSVVFAYVVFGEHEDETIRSLAEKFSPSAESSAVECCPQSDRQGSPENGWGQGRCRPGAAERSRRSMSGDEGHLSTGERERNRQEMAFIEVLERFPVTLTVDELVRTLATRRLGDEDREPWEQAVTQLRRDGLLRLNGNVVEPTVAAIRASELMEVGV